ncbi:MAG: hypothetical protein ACLQPH_17515 [Acidimicrobiales bacterium]
MENIGAKAKEALLAVMGGAQIEVDVIRELLIEKGVFTEHEFSHAMEARFNAPFAVADVEWARRHMDPEDATALDQFFG